MWIKKLKHKKTQFLLIGVMLLVISTVFCTCLSFTLELQTYAKNRFSREYCPDVFVYSLNNTEAEANFPTASVRDNISSMESLRGKNISVPMKHKATNISSITNMLCTMEDPGFLKYTEFIAGGAGQSEPGDGEIWIVKTLASSYDIEIGDVLTIAYAEPLQLKVSGIYIATFAPSERLTIMPNIVNQNTLDQLAHEPDAGVFAINLFDHSEDRLNELAMGNPYALLTFSRARLVGYITDISGILGSVAAVAAFVVFIAALFIIRFIIHHNIQKELRSIGIYKSQGFSVRQIRQVYIKGYLLVGSTVISLGAILSLPFVYFLGRSTSQVLGHFRLTATTGLVCMFALLLLVFSLWSGARMALDKLKSISPVEAITAGQALGEQKRQASLIKCASSPFTTEINNIFKHKKTSFLTLIVLTISLYLILFFSSSYYTCKNIYENANIWLACPQFNSIVTGEIHQELSEFIKASGYVKSVINGDFFHYPPVTIPQYDGNPRAVEFTVLDVLDEQTTGIAMKAGRGPKNPEEIAVSEKLLKQLELGVGDELKIGIRQEEEAYRISGMFTSVEELSILMSIDGMRKIDPRYEPENSFIMLKDEAEFDAFKTYVEANFAGVSVDKEWTALKSAVAAIEKMLTNVMTVLLGVFILFAVISIVNVLVLNINFKRRQYGILKAMGFSTNYLLTQNFFHVLLMFGAGTVTAACFHFLCSKHLFALLIIDAMRDSIALSGSLLLGTTIAAVAAALLFSGSIWKIKPVHLMEE